MKRITAIILILSLCLIQLTSFAAEQSAEQEIYIPAELKKAVETFKYIDILENDFDIEKATTDNITRAEFAVYLAKALKFDGSFKDIYFTDVDSRHVAVNEIGFLVEQGIISLAEDNMFDPNDPVRAEQAVKMMFKANGYDIVADMSGGYPTGYLQTAQKLKLLSDIKDTASLTVGEALVIMYRMMEIGVYSPVVMSQNEMTYAGDEDTLFSLHWDIYIDEGQLENIYGMSVNDSYVEEKDQVVINGEKYINKSNVDLKELVASNVEFLYYKYKETKELIYASVYGKEEKLTISTDDIIGFDSLNYTLKYYNKNTAKEKSLSRQMRFIFNGRLYTGKLDTIFEKIASGEYKGEMQIKILNNQTYVILTVYKIYLIGTNTVGDNTIIYNKLNTAETKELAKFGQVIVKRTNGTEVDIKTGIGGVVSIAESMDGVCIEIIGCDTKIGTVKIMGDDTLKVDDTEYEIDEYAKKNGILPAQMAGNYTVYIDKFGEVVYAEFKADQYMFGYVINSHIEDGLSDEINFKILTDTNEVKIYKAASSVSIDGNRYKGRGVYNALCETADTLSESPVSVRQLIRFMVNSDGEISKIDTVRKGNSETDSSLHHKNYGLNQTRFEYNYSGFGPNMTVDTKTTKLFLVPRVDSEGYVFQDWSGPGWYWSPTPNEYLLDDDGNKVKEDDYMFVANDFNYLNIGQFYSAEGFKINDEDLVTEAVIVYYNIYKENSEVIMISEIYEGAKEDGTVGKYLSGYSRHGAVNYEVEYESQLEGLNIGDLVRLSHKYKTNEICKIQRVYNAVTHKFESQNQLPTSTPSITYVTPWWQGYVKYDNELGVVTEAYYSESRQLAKGEVLKKQGNYLSLDWDGDRVADQVENVSGLVFITKSENDRYGTEVGTGSFDDILDYETVGDKCSKVVVSSIYLSGRAVFIFN
ncbi:MAG: S-layer homology domain-containing protein [Ruminococcaceae bacterium]|nr:S-layer homology domain-containing protein [Oscillospiraceae bacterium]